MYPLLLFNHCGTINRRIDIRASTVHSVFPPGGGLGGARRKNKLCTVLAHMSIRLFIVPEFLKRNDEYINPMTRLKNIGYKIIFDVFDVKFSYVSKIGRAHV